MKVKNTLRVIVIGLLVLICWFRLAGRNQIPEEYKRFLELPLSQRHEVFRSYPIEKQLAVYHYAIRNQMPFDYGYAYDIAEGGKKIIPIVLDKLKIEKDEDKQKDIIRIFHALAVKGYLSNREDIIDQLNQVVSGMKRTDSVKEESQRLLADIQEESTQ
jgi:hypothetical protein